MKKINYYKLEEYAGFVAGNIFGLTSVPDDFINQLKVYKKFEFEEGQTGAIWLITIGFYLELLSGRIEDLVDQKDLKYIITEIKSILLTLIRQLMVKEGADREEAGRELFEHVEGVIRRSKERQKNNNIGVIEAYVVALSSLLNNKLSEDVLNIYAKSRAELFEDQKYRQKLQEIVS